MILWHSTYNSITVSATPVTAKRTTHNGRTIATTRMGVDKAETSSGVLEGAKRNTAQRSAIRI
jgi:hypothetical protein